MCDLYIYICAYAASCVYLYIYILYKLYESFSPGNYLPETTVDKVCPV